MPLDHHDAQSCPLGHRGIVGEGGRFVSGQFRGRPVGGEELGEAKDLRCLGAPQAGARDSADEHAVVHLLQRVGEAHAQDGAVHAGPHRLEAADDVGHTNERAGGVMDGDQVGRLRAKASRPLSTDCWRLIHPERAAGRSRPAMASR